jgi:hypothetical protein
VGERQLEGLEEKKTHRFEYRENIGSKPQASRAHEPTDDTETEALIDPMRSYGHTREIPTTEAYQGQHLYQTFSKMLHDPKLHTGEFLRKSSHMCHHHGNLEEASKF